MFGGAKIKIEKNLMERIRAVAEKEGYSSPEEFIVHVLEKEVSSHEKGDDVDEEEMKKKLQGLGYIS